MHRDEQKISLIPLFERAPEICVEILSPSNSIAEIDQKRALYFDAGAGEVWICNPDGSVSFLSLLIINKLPLLCFTRRSLTGFPAHLARSPDISARRCRLTRCPKPLLQPRSKCLNLSPPPRTLRAVLGGLSGCGRDHSRIFIYAIVAWV